MNALRGINRTTAAIAAAVVLVVLLGFLAFGTGDTKKVSAHFPEAISVYTGSDVDVMGIRIGRVTKIVPEGSTVRVDMEYDAKYKLPADVSAAIVTPTLVADRFIQLAPAYAGGTAMKDGGDIPVARSHQPVEIDQLYSSLSQLTKTLGPDGINKNGTLNQLLSASAKALNGNGAAGNSMLANMGAAAQTLGDNSDHMFQTVDRLAALTGTLAQNDAVVSNFITQLTAVSGELAGEKDDLAAALAAIANAVGTVQQFIHDNKAMAVQDLQKLTETLKVIADQKETLGKVLQLSALGLGNLTEAYDAGTGTEAIRLQLGPEATDLGNVLCGVLKVNNMPNVDTACTLLKALLPGTSNIGAGAGVVPPASNVSAPPGGLAGILNPALRLP